jgi:excisionase family DNA binding protein
MTGVDRAPQWRGAIGAPMPSALTTGAERARHGPTEDNPEQPMEEPVEQLPSGHMTPNLLNTSEVARLLRVHRHTVDRERIAGRLACVRIGTRVLFTEAQVRDYVRSRQTRAGGP